MNASRIAHLRVALCQRAHGRIMKRRGANVTFGFGVRGHIRVRRRTDSLWRTLKAATRHRTPQRRAIRYLDQLGGLETAALCSCSCNADSRSLLTISSTKAASDRGKMNEYFGPFAAPGEIRRFSERKPGS